MPATVRDVLDLALNRIRTYGWDYRYSVTSQSPMNIRSAVAHACTHYFGEGKQWYDAYSAATTAISRHIGTGIQNWEFPASKISPKQSEVENMLIAVIEKQAAGVR